MPIPANAQSGLDLLFSEAETLARQQPGAVTDKPAPASSGDPHDFSTIGRYCWPNPDTPDGMPWIRIDCEVNDASYGPRYDLTRYKEMVEAVVRLSLAYRHFGGERFAEGAAARLDRWFLDPGTAMNPNLNHAAALPGVHDGVYYGVIQGAVMTRVPYAAGLLAGSAHWPADADRRLRDWFGRYTTWLTTSPFGREQAERGKNNNTMVWYHAQRAVFGHYAGQPSAAADGLRSIAHCLDGQIELDGSLPRELSRPDSLIYSVYCLTGVANAAELAPLYGIDLWGHRTPDGATLRGCFDYLEPYLAGHREWTAPQRHLGTPDQAIWLFRMAARAYGQPSYRQVAEQLAGKPSEPGSYLFGELYDPFFRPFDQG
ncbi:alginate lyase family protein [Jiangella muralis]|uniref:alginate lyase family protein n=1 Tax=Jiangella muralis TaxID=702383 RepID=UPI0014702A80|nr:alginate lyase family protein [Jiangella muralis]